MALPQLRCNVVGRLKRALRESVAAPADRARPASPEEDLSESESESEVEQQSLRRSTREKRKASDEGCKDNRTLPGVEPSVACAVKDWAVQGITGWCT
jgi:hypothetical protein